MKRFQKITKGVLYALLCVVLMGCSSNDSTYCITVNWGSIGEALLYLLIGGIVVFVVLIRGIFGD